jgi:S-(hydroxymethyl)glutathione dehydrogenase/alcohol dehydrogenase
LRGAVLANAGDATLVVRDDIRLVGDVGPREVRVRIRATGICHSDLSAIDGVLPAPIPFIPGHEAAGDVIAVGESVQSVEVGDRVILTLIPPCGNCRFCLHGQANLCDSVVNPFDTPPRYEADGEPLFSLGGISSWVEEVILPEQGVIRIANDVPYDVAAIVGCAVTTGVGAVLNTAKLAPGSTVAVFGCGGVGMSVIQGAQLAGASAVMAIDLSDEKLKLAQSLGATHVATPSQASTVGDSIHDGLGFDVTFEAIGRGATIRDAYDAARRGGTTVVVGAGGMEDMVEFSAFELFYFERTIKGSVYGSADVRRDFPLLLDLWRAGRLDLQALVTRHLALDDINDGIAALRAGREIRQVVEFA